MEAGLPLTLSPTVTAEPQVQVVWQHLSVNDLTDQASTVAFDNANSTLMRAGVRVQKVIPYQGATWQPYFRADVMHMFDSTGQTIFAGTTTVPTGQDYTAARFEFGVVGKSGRHGSVYATAGYLTSLGGPPREGWFGNLGVRWSW